MIKLVAFDWDGTLVSNTKAALDAENKTFKAIGVKPLTLKQFQDNFEIPIMKYWENLGLSKKFVKSNYVKMEGLFHPAYEKNMQTTRARLGVKNILVWLRKNKILSIVYSNHHIPGIKKHLVRLKVYDFFDEVLARQHAHDDSQIYKRSKEEKLFNYVKSNKIKPKEVITVGDTEEEIEIGKKLGYFTVAIIGGWNSVDRLKKHKPDFLIHNMLELKSIIQKLNK